MAKVCKTSKRELTQIFEIDCDGEESHLTFWDAKKKVFVKSGGDEVELAEHVRKLFRDGNYKQDGRWGHAAYQKCQIYCETIPEFKKLHDELIAEVEPKLKEGEVVWVYENVSNSGTRMTHNFFKVGEILGYQLSDGCGPDGEKFSEVKVIREFINTETGNTRIAGEEPWGTVSDYEEWNVLDKIVKQMKKKLGDSKEAFGATVTFCGKVYKV